MGWKVWGLNPGRGKRPFFCPKCPDWPWRQPNFEVYRGSIPDTRHVGHEINHSPPSIADVQNEWCYTSTTPVCLLVWTRELYFFTYNSKRVDD